MRPLRGEAPLTSLRILPRERRIIQLRDGGESLAAIATTLGVSRERVRQIERVARRKATAVRLGRANT
jgi:DNA-directed RNA polymerase sigma subunit (sigma70/sigma32)